jgi:hypothetical protein
MKRWIAAVAVIVLGIGLWLGLRKPPAGESHSLTFLFTCDVRGRLVPCGCFTGQLGGLTRIATMVGKGSTPGSLKVDIGDAIEGTADYEVLEYRYLQQAFAQMGYAALNVGHREAALPAAQLRELKTQSPVPMLSANLLDRSTGQPLFATHRIVQQGPWRLALVGVLDPRSGDELGDGLAIEKMETSLATLLPVLKSQVDFIVLLAFTDEPGLTALARQFYEVDVILGGKVAQPSPQLLRENRSLLLATTNQSRALGALEVKLESGAKMVAVKGDIALVNDQIPEDPGIRSLATAYRDEMRSAKLTLDDPANLQGDMVPGVKASATYVGTATCSSCHPSATKVWSGTGHAQAFSTLVQAEADADPNCIGCHTVGFGTPSGYRREFKAAKLVDVGCESCHGPGSQHLAERSAGSDVLFHFRKLGRGDCQKCHHGEFSRPFDYDQFWPLVQHGKEPRGAPTSGPVNPR